MMAALKIYFVILTDLKMRGMPHMGDAPGNTRVGQEAKGGGTCGQELLLWFLWKGTNKTC